jgi:hypothetical protein
MRLAADHTPVGVFLVLAGCSLRPISPPLACSSEPT